MKQSPEAPSSTLLSVIIPVYHDWERLQLCLECLRHQNVTTTSFEIIVINNDPSDMCPYQASFPDVMWLVEERTGSYAARNRGVRAARGEILAFTDADCQPDVGWLQNGVELLLSQKDYQLIGGRIEFIWSKSPPSVVELTDFCLSFNQHLIRKGQKHGVTANLMAHRRVFEAVGLFDAALRSGGDVAWCERAADHGFRIGYAETAVVLHPSRSSLGELTKKRLRVFEGQFMRAKTPCGRLLDFLSGPIPPFWDIRKMQKISGFPMSRKAGVFFLMYLLKMLRSIWFLRWSLLYCGRSPEIEKSS